MKKTLMSCLVGLALATTAHAGTLLPPGANDQSPSQLLAAPLPAGEFERQPVSFAWALDPKAALQTLDLSKDYGDGMGLVTELDLKIGAGELVMLVGPNGAGKSTFLGLASGMLEPSNGWALTPASPSRSTRTLPTTRSFSRARSSSCPCPNRSRCRRPPSASPPISRAN